MIYYLPLLAVYFSHGLGSITAVLHAAFLREYVNLSATELVSIAAYSAIPWSVKMLFGTVIDSVNFFGNNRKSYIYLGQVLLIMSAVVSIDNGVAKIVSEHIGMYGALLLAGVLGSCGAVISDIVADVMQIELVDKTDEAEMAKVQVYSRLALSAGAILGAYFSGYVASLPIEHGYLYLFIGPMLAILATATVKLPDLRAELRALNRPILLGGLVYLAFVFLSGKYLGLEWTFVGSLIIVILMMVPVVKEVPNKYRFSLIILAIFLFRVTPGIGPAGNWWYTNSLGFSSDFLSQLAFTSAVSSLIIVFFFKNKIGKYSILRLMSVLTVLSVILSLPDILIYYKMVFGINPRSIVLLDTAAAGSLGSIAMIPLGVLVAKNAPRANVAVYTTVVASLMNISLVGGDVLTSYLVKAYPVSRTDFTHMGELLLSSLTVGTLCSMLGLCVLWIIRSKNE